MMSFLRNSKLAAKAILMVFAFCLIGVQLLPAQESYPAVARLSFISGPVTYSRGDDPDEWDDAVENLALTIGDRIYTPEDSRAELQLSSGNFVRIAPQSYLSTLNLSDDIKQFYLGEGVASFNIRRLQSDEVIEIDTPNLSVTLEEPGQYRVAVDEDGNSRITVRRGRVIAAASGRQVAVESSEIRVYGIDSPRYEIVRLPATDAFDRWVSERDDRFERAYSDAYRHASEDIIGAEDLADYGRWEEIPEYGYAWTPSRVAAGWAPFSDGRWYWQDPWGWSWISNQRWGWATSHYGRWTPYRSRWYWVPVRPRTRVRYAPAVVEFVRVRDHVGWFPLHPRDRHVPWWERRDRRPFGRNVTYVNRTYVTVINHNHFVSARPVQRYIVRDSLIVREVRSARFTSDSLPIPNRSSLRVISENGGRRGFRPADKIVKRAAVVRTQPPPAPRAFQDKLPEIQKNLGKAVEPARILAAAQDDRAKTPARVRPAAEANRGDFAPRHPGANAGPAPQPLTEARGKKLATRQESGANNAEKTDRAQKTPVPPAQTAPSKGTASRPETPRLERDRQREENLTLERQRQTQQQQQEIEGKNQAQQKVKDGNAQLQKQQQERERQGQVQKQRQPERRQAEQKEEERKAQPQKQPAQERRQERQSAQQRLDELERRPAQQRQEERKSQLQQNREQQERQAQPRQQHQENQRKSQAQQQQLGQVRREQLKQQQLQDRQERPSQQQRQEPERAQQLRQQPAQAQRAAQQAKQLQEPERRPQSRQSQQRERQVRQTARQPAQL